MNGGDAANRVLNRRECEYLQGVQAVSREELQERHARLMPLMQAIEDPEVAARVLEARDRRRRKGEPTNFLGL